MDAGVLMLALAGASGFAAAFAFVRAAQQARRRSSARKIFQDGNSASADTFLAQLLRNGVPALGWCVELLMRVGPVNDFLKDMTKGVRSKGGQTTVIAFGSLLLVALFAIACLASLVALTPVAGVAACALVVVVCELRIQSWKQARRDEVCERVPEALETMGECFQSGYSLVQTMEMTARQTKGDLGRAFERCADTLRLGGTTKEALAVLREIDGANELSFVAVALDVQHQSGGSIVPILAASQELVQCKVELQRDLRVQTAQARLSAQVVCLMPFALVAILSLVTEGFLAPFFSSAAGAAMLALAIFMEGAGIALVRKMLKGVEQ